MQSFHFSLESSSWWLVAIVIVSGSMAWLLYSGSNIWNRQMRILLGSLRFITICLVLLLLLNPQITFVKSFKEKPLFPIVVDNSQSVTMVMKNQNELKESIRQMQDKLQGLGFESNIITHNRQVQSVDSFSFGHTSSDISLLLSKSEKQSANKKPTGMLLISDGIYNSGISPAYTTYRSPISVLGLGDTVPRKDLILKSLQNNSVAFLGNKFTLRAEIHSVGFVGHEVELLLRSKDGIVEKKRIKVNTAFWYGKVDFAVPATEKGFQKYTIEVVPLKGESNLLNNKLNAYVDVVDDRETILLVSESPHPNIKAMRAALNKMENIHLEVLIPGISEPKSDAYDLVILHNCLANTVVGAKKYMKESTSILYIAGSLSDFNRFNAENGLIEVVSRNETDQVSAVPNAMFSRFKLNENSESTFGKLPPVEVPFGDLKPRAGVDVALFQKINSVQSSKPLLVFGQSVRKTGVLLTDGLWLWRMYEAQETGKADVVDELITKTVQYLSSKEDKRKFRIYPHQREYMEGESPKIEAELYNDLYEKVWGQKVEVKLTAAGAKPKTFEYVPTESNATLALPVLAAGVYKVEAKTNYSGKELTSLTEFIIKERQLEALDLQANHTLLRDLARKNNGFFASWQNRAELLKTLEKLEAKPVWRSEEKTRELIGEIWYYYLIVLFISAEWIIRRYTGGY